MVLGEAYLLVAGCAALVVLIVAANWIIVGTTAKHIVFSRAKLDPVPWPIAIVLGARVWPSGRPSLMLEDRLETALELYRDGSVEKLLVSGDDSLLSQREVTVMAKWLADRGIPTYSLVLDPSGKRTFLTMVNARRAGVRRALIVTQSFHLPRALWLAKSQGIEAVGIPADRRTYPKHLYLRVWTREIGARVVAFCEGLASRIS